MKKIKVENLAIQPLDKNGLKTLLSWAKNEGWNPGTHDIDAFWAADPEGFYGFYANNELIAGGSVVSYHGEFGFMGLFIVHPDFRGNGIGEKLWHLRKNLLLSRLKPKATIGMDGVVAMQPFYNKGGFNIAFKDVRYEFTGKHYTYSELVTPIQQSDFTTIANYDQTCFGYPRTNFLREWLKLPNSNVIQFSTDNTVKGYAVIREVNNGFKIGPLFANSPKIAEELFKACLNTALDAPVYLDIPLVNQQAIELVEKYKGKYTFECARMYLGPPPKTDIQKTYGITTFELG